MTALLRMILLGATASALLATAPAQAVTIYISGTGSGCSGGPNGQACSNGAQNMFAGSTVNLISPVTETFDAGTYTITNGDLTGDFSGWRFNGAPNWVWNFGITTDNGNGTGNVFLVGGSGGIFGTQAGIAQSNGANYGGSGGPVLPLLSPSGGPSQYSLTFTLAAATTLNFFVLDYYLPDNAGGVALKIDEVGQVPLPAALPLFASALIGGGVMAWRKKRKQKGEPLAA
jgi:hypothetical protein